MARTVADAMLVLEAIAGTDERDPATRALEIVDGAATRSAWRADRRGAEPRRVPPGRGRAVRGGDRRAARRSGPRCVDPADVPHADDLEGPELEVLLYEFKADLEAYLAQVPGAAARTLDELIAFNLDHVAEEMPFFGQEIFEQAVEKGPLTERAYLEALATCGRLSREEGLDAAFERHGVEILVAPTELARLADRSRQRRPLRRRQLLAPAVAGTPSVTVPMGDVSRAAGRHLVPRPRRGVTRRSSRSPQVFERATRHRIERRRSPPRPRPDRARVHVARRRGPQHRDQHAERRDRDERRDHAEGERGRRHVAEDLSTEEPWEPCGTPAACRGTG